MVKVIHCCWFGGPETELARRCRASWERCAPDWEIRVWNRENASALADLPGWAFFEAALGAKKWAMASDWLRMAVLWKVGGVYLDCDVELVGGLDPLCAAGEWIASERTVLGVPWLNPGSGLALEKGSPLAQGMLAAYADVAFDRSRDMMPWINERLRAVLDGWDARRPAPRILAPEVMSPVDLRGACRRTAATVGVHHYAYSWGSPRQRFLRWVSWHGGRGLVDALLKVYWRCGFGAGAARRPAAVLVMHPAPYRDPVLDELAKCGGVEIFSIWKNDGGHDWAGFGAGCDAPVLDGRFLCLRLLARFVLSGRYSTVVWPAYRPWWLTLPILLSALIGARYALSSDTKEENGGGLARAIKRFIFRRAAFVWVPGEAAARFLSANYGVPDERILRGLYLVDPGRIVRNARPTAGGGVLRFLTVANDVPLRRLDVLVDAFASWNGGNAELTLCGRGCGRFAGRGVRGLEGVVWNELSRLYDAADVYVHNGSEQYSTAVQIAALRGLPVVCASEVGIVSDFADPDRVLVRVDDGRSPAAWQEALARIASISPEERRALGDRLRRDAEALYDVKRTATEVMGRLRPGSQP